MLDYARPRTLAIFTPGKKKDKWEERMFTLTKKGLSWCVALQPTLESARYQHFAETGIVPIQMPWHKRQ